MNILDGSIENIADNIIMINKAGPITEYPTSIPDNSIHSYNKLLGLAVYFTNGETSNNEIDRDLLLKKLFFSSRIYEKSVCSLIDKGYTEDQINQYSPVLILDSFTSTIDKPVLLDCAESHIYSTLTLIFLYRFKQKIIDIDQLCYKKDRLQVLENIVLAQSYIAVALDSYNSSLGLLYRARENTLKRLAPTSEIELQLELDRNKYPKSKGGRSSKYEPYRTRINSYFNNLTTESNGEIRSAIHNIINDDFNLTSTSPDNHTIRSWKNNHNKTCDILTR
jgi:hypothetical protein